MSQQYIVVNRLGVGEFPPILVCAKPKAGFQILSHTFSNISNDAAMEAMFRKAVSTIEG
jgi:hypothetical protein